MNPSRIHLLERAVIAFLTLIGWLVLSNHCALGSAFHPHRAQQQHACCQSGKSSEGESPARQEGGPECCKSVHVIMPAAAEVAAPAAQAMTFELPLAVEVEAVEAEEVAELDTGPPERAESFSRLVLQRSLRAHAPPPCC